MISLLVSLFSGRLRQFELSLQSISKQKFSKEMVELLVFVDYVENLDALEMLGKYRGFFSSIRAYAVVEKKYQVAHSASRRNFLATQARGSHIVFSEPEMLHIGPTIAYLLSIIDSTKMNNWICGPVYAGEDFVDEAGKIIVNDYRKISKIEDLLSIAQVDNPLEDKTFLKHFHKIDYENYTTPFFFVCFNRNQFLKLGGLNQNLLVRGYEETEFFKRFRQAGGKIVIDPNLITLHLPHQRSLDRETQVCWDLYNSTVTFNKNQRVGEIRDANFHEIEFK